jgi:hypothetical protein
MSVAPATQWGAAGTALTLATDYDIVDKAADNPDGTHCIHHAVVLFGLQKGWAESRVAVSVLIGIVRVTQRRP